MTADEFGLDRTFRMSPGFQRLVSGNGPKISAALAQLTQKDQAYRQVSPNPVQHPSVVGIVIGVFHALMLLHA